MICSACSFCHACFLSAVAYIGALVQNPRSLVYSPVLAHCPLNLALFSVCDLLHPVSLDVQGLVPTCEYQRIHRVHSYKNKKQVF